MRSIHGVIVTAIAAAVLIPAAVTSTAAAALPGRQTAPAAAACRVAGTIWVGRDSRGVAVNPVTNTICVANVQSSTVSRISGSPAR
jgi:DNA-binding beta-propeller fold protein YncE